MKKQILVVGALALLLGVGFLAFNMKDNQPGQTESTEGFAFITLHNRSGELAQTREWQAIKENAAAYVQRIKTNAGDLKAKLLLAQLYIQEARVTGEHPYYYPGTLVLLDDILTRDSVNFDAYALKSLILLSQHHFAEALEVGNRGRELNRNNGFIYGVLVDANVELGRYTEAIRVSDTMQTLRPGLEAYARASYLRELHGDYRGAIVAMRLAADAGQPTSEQASWTRTTLGHLFRLTGQLDSAEVEYATVLQNRPSYAFAIAGLAEVERARGNNDKAMELLEKACGMMPEFSFFELQADLYAEKGQQTNAMSVYAQVMTMLEEDAASGHFSDMEMAEVYIKMGNLDKAFQHAKIEHERRPENISTNNTMAWVQYHRGNYAEARTHIQTAMRTGYQNAELLARAGLIEIKAGNEAAGRKLLLKAFQINPYLPNDIMTLARPYIAG